MAEQFLILAYYKYTCLPEAETFTEKHLEYCRKLGLRGRIIVADEGLNGTVSGLEKNCREYMHNLQSLSFLHDIEFKIHQSDRHAFKKLNVRYKSEIVNSGLAEMPEIDPLQNTGVHLEPEDFKQMKDQEDVVVLDVRSNYEHQIGHFKNALTMDIDHFRDFPEEVKQLEKQLEGKKIVTYCTGGVKCEKASALLLKKGFKEVYQLHGGILNYARESGGYDFEGKCYVFDNRVAVDVNSVNPLTIATCTYCGGKTSRMINCANADCNKQFVVCDDCGWEWAGCCSEECYKSPARRPYDGSGYYAK